MKKFKKKIIILTSLILHNKIPIKINNKFQQKIKMKVVIKNMILKVFKTNNLQGKFKIILKI